MAFLATVGWCLLAAVVLQCVAFTIAYFRNKRYDFVDVVWGLQFIVIAVTAYTLSENKTIVGLIMLAMVLIWGLRLASHIFRRWLRSDHEDGRYVSLRQSWPSRYVDAQVFVRTYLLQAVLAIVVSLPVVVVMYSQGQLNWLHIIGALVWVVGLTIESIADRQLRRFVQQPTNRGKLLTTGLWGLSRHPNYFGEISLWWGIALMALGSSYGWLGLIGAALITYLIRYVSGVPLSEKSLSEKSGWEKYRSSTRLLIPIKK